MQHALLWAASGTDTSDPVLALVQYGALGIIVILLVIYTRGSLTRERTRTDKAEQQVDKLNEYIRDALLPKMGEATLLYKQVSEVLEEAIQLITEMKVRDNIHRQDPPPHETPTQRARRGG
jgi:hypothetical protein